jgi:hypothetical protein
VNREHFRAFLWLRWRLRVNQFRKAGPVNAVFFAVFVALALLAAVGLLVAGFLVGFFVLPEAPPVAHLLMWDGVIVVLLFFWMIGLLTDLQRTEGLAIDKVLHLPVSPSGAFLINYLSSLFSLTLIAFLPGMLGLILGQVCAGSVAVLLALPLLAAFVLALTAVTYQFQGWLASLVTNPRRRRTVIVLVTAGFILVAQLPNLVNLARPWEGEKGTDALTRWNEQRKAADADLDAKKLTAEEYTKRQNDIQKEFENQRKEELRRTLSQVEQTARLVSLVFPPGWLALGASATARGAALPALFGTLGFGLIGAFSLRRAYRTTIRLYTGAYTGQERRSAPPAARPIDLNRVRLLEWRLPWVSEHASAVAVAAFRSLTRAPEAKMLLIVPVILLVVFAGSMMSAKADPPIWVRPLMALGSGTMVLLICGAQLIGNQFGYDRAGFRAYVLSPVPRRAILLGKNLAVAPLGLGMGLFLMVLVGVVYPMRIDHYPAAVAQLVSAYLVFCLLANALSILAPVPMAAGSMQPAQVKLIPVLLQLAFMTVLPVALVPVLVPIGVEVLLAELAGVRGLPVSLVLSLVVLAVTVFVYRMGLKWEGDWLAAREQAVLETVTSTGE